MGNPGLHELLLPSEELDTFSESRGQGRVEPGRTFPSRGIRRDKSQMALPTRGSFLQQTRHCRTMDQRGQTRDSMDEALLPEVPGQRGEASAIRSRLQPWELHSDTGATRRSEPLVAHNPQGEADQDWCEGRVPWAIHYLPTRRGRGIKRVVR